MDLQLESISLPEVTRPSFFLGEKDCSHRPLFISQLFFGVSTLTSLEGLNAPRERSPFWK